MKNVKNILLKIIPYIIILVLTVVIVRQCNNNNDMRNQMEHNVDALKDSVHHYKTKSGDIAAQKAILLGDMDLLKKTNDSLYNKVKELGVKNPQEVVYITNEIIREKHDTTWTVHTPEINERFDFSDNWRDLTGNVSLKDSILGLTIDKDIVRMDYTMAIKDGRVYISSTNPYVRFNDIQGIAIPKVKQKHWHIGPSITAGICTDGKFRPTAGVSLSYSIISW